MFKRFVCFNAMMLALLVWAGVSSAAEEGVAVATLYTDAAKDVTHFRTDVLEWSGDTSGAGSNVPPVTMTKLYPATQIGYVRIPAGYRADWHPAPRKQYVMVLRGKLEVEAGDGEKREFTPGSVLLVTDVTGRGHKTNALGDEDVFLVWAPIP